MARASPPIRSPSLAFASCSVLVVAALFIHVSASRPQVDTAAAADNAAGKLPKAATPYTQRGPGSRTYGTQYIAPEIFENLDERFAKHTEDDGRDALLNLAKDLYITAHGERTSLQTAVDDVRGLNPLMRNADHDAEAAQKAADVLAKDGVSAMYKGAARNQGSIDAAADILKQGHKSVYGGVTRHEGHLFAKQGYTSDVHGQDDIMPSQLQERVVSSQDVNDADAGLRRGGRQLKERRSGTASLTETEQDVRLMQGCQQGDGTDAWPLCSPRPCEDEGRVECLTSQDCGTLIVLPPGREGTGYNFFESATWVPAMKEEGKNFLYVPATRCHIPNTEDLDMPMDDTTCNAKGNTTVDIFKVFADPAIDHSHVDPVATIPNFKAFGSKVTNDGRYLFVCDLDHQLIIAIDMKDGGLKAVFTNAYAPNDIALWEGPGGKVVIFTAGGNMNTYVFAATVGIRASPTADITWTSGCAATAIAGGQGCDFQTLPDNCPKCYLSRALKATPAGIGVTSAVGDTTPNVWIATLSYFAYLKLDGQTDIPSNSGTVVPMEQYWGLADPSWAQNFGCTLPGAYSNHRAYGLIDNVVMVDPNTMITAIYTDCHQGPIFCLARNYTTGTMFSKNDVSYNVVAFTRVCMNQYQNLGDFSEFTAASRTYVYPLPAQDMGDHIFNGRITHIQAVGDDLVAINYQWHKVMIFKNVVPHIRCQ